MNIFLNMEIIKAMRFLQEENQKYCTIGTIKEQLKKQTELSNRDKRSIPIIVENAAKEGILSSSKSLSKRVGEKVYNLNGNNPNTKIIINLMDEIGYLKRTIKNQAAINAETKPIKQESIWERLFKKKISRIEDAR